MNDGNITSQTKCLIGQFPSHFTRGPGGQNPDIIHRFFTSAAGNEDLFPCKRPAGEKPFTPENDLVDVSNFCFPLFYPGPDYLNANIFQDDMIIIDEQKC